MKRIVRGAAALGLAGVLALTASGCSLFPKEADEPVPVVAPPTKSEKETFTAHTGEITEQVSLRGRFSPARQEDMYYKDPGRIKTIYVRAGDIVKKGQPLAEVFTDDAAYQAAQAELRYEKAQLALDDAKYRAQFTRGPAAESEIKQREIDLEGARLDRDKWQATVAAARMVAPFDGVITAMNAKAGDMVAAYAPILTLSDPSSLIVEADVDDAALTKLAVGQKAILDFADIGDKYGEGQVVELPDLNAKATATSTQPQRIKVKPTGDIGKAAMGSVGKVNVVLQQKPNVLLIDNAAIRQFSGKTYVLMKQPRREVEVVLGIAGERESEVVRGLKEGDEVVAR